MENTRTRSKDTAKVLMVVIGVLTVSLVALLIWGAVLLTDQQTAQPEQLQGTTAAGPEQQEPVTTDPPETDPPQTKPNETKPSETKPTETQPTETKPTETNPAEPQPSDPDEPSDPLVAAAQTVSAFAAQHGLTLDDYPQKLVELLARNPETEEYVLNYPLEYGKDHPIDISGHADDEGVPLFIQWDEQWGYLDYTGNVAGLTACGPTSMAMVMYHFTRDPKYTPAYMMEFAESNSSYAVDGYGTQWAFFKLGGRELGLDVRELTSEQIRSEQKIASVLSSGRVIVMNVSPGVFTTVGHYLLVVGYEDGKFRVNDPNSRINSEKLWEFEEFADQIKMMWSYSL